MVQHYHSSVVVYTKTAKGYVFFRRLFNRQKCIVNAFSVTRICPRVL